MKKGFKQFLKNLFISLIVLSIPTLLCFYGFQAKKYTDLTKEISELEKNQEKLIEENKKLVNEISILSSADRIERIATEELGMHKAETEDIVRVEMTGERR